MVVKIILVSELFHDFFRMQIQKTVKWSIIKKLFLSIPVECVSFRHFLYTSYRKKHFHLFGTDRMLNNAQHTLELKVTDNKRNTTEYKASFFW